MKSIIKLSKSAFYFVVFLVAFIIIPSVSHAAAPTVTSSAATAIGTSTATLHGNITADNGASSTIEGFFYGTTTAYGSVASTTGTFGQATPITQNLTGLTPGSTYYFETFASSTGGLGTSSQSSFTASSTVPNAPTAVTASTSTPSQATVSWTPPAFNGGTTTLYYTLISSPAAYAATTTATSTIATGLTNGTSYTFTVSETNLTGIGATSTASNAVVPLNVPTVTIASTTPITTTTATLNGSITADGGASSTVVGFEYGTDTTYGTVVSSSAGPFGLGAFSIAISSLTCATTYHYRSYSTSAGGTASSTDGNFVTSACPVAAATPTVSSGSFSSGGGSMSAAQLGALLAPSAAATAYLNSLKGYTAATLPGCPVGFVCTPNNPSVTNNSANGSVGVGSGVGTGAGGGVGTGGSSFSRNLQLGNTGQDVKALQIYLNTHGYTISAVGAGSPGNETTTFGSLTKKALIKFQKDHNISPTGYFGQITRGAVGM